MTAGDGQLSRLGAGADAQASRRPSGHGVRFLCQGRVRQNPALVSMRTSETEREDGRLGGAADPYWADAPAPQAGETL